MVVAVGRPPPAAPSVSSERLLSLRWRLRECIQVPPEVGVGDDDGLVAHDFGRTPGDAGRDGGGHVGKIGTAALVPAVVDAVDVPVLAGGGLADGRGLVAALSLGAQGCWLDTRFIATAEARAHQAYKERIAETDSAGTVVTRAHSGKPCRLIRNNFTDSWAGREAEIEPFPLQILHVGHEASERGRIQGHVDDGVLPAGQSAGLILEVIAAGQVVHDVIDEARAVLTKLAG